jgi:hypothetical protein
VKNNKIAPVGDYAPRLENQSSRAILSTPNVNSVIAGGISLFFSCFVFGIGALSLDADKTFHKSRNQTSFAENLGEDGKYGFALAISASTFLTSFLLTRNYLRKIDRQNNDQNNGAQVSAQLVFGVGHPRTSFQNTNSSTNSISNSNNSR